MRTKRRVPPGVNCGLYAEQEIQHERGMRRQAAAFARTVRAWRVPLAVYSDAGAKAGRACKHGDAAGARFYTEWMRRAVRLESPQWAAMASAEFNAAYTAEATPNGGRS